MMIPSVVPTPIAGVPVQMQTETGASLMPNGPGIERDTFATVFDGFGSGSSPRTSPLFPGAAAEPATAVDVRGDAGQDNADLPPAPGAGLSLVPENPVLPTAVVPPVPAAAANLSAAPVQSLAVPDAHPATVIGQTPAAIDAGPSAGPRDLPDRALTPVLPGRPPAPELRHPPATPAVATTSVASAGIPDGNGTTPAIVPPSARHGMAPDGNGATRAHPADQVSSSQRSDAPNAPRAAAAQPPFLSGGGRVAADAAVPAGTAASAANLPDGAESLPAPPDAADPIPPGADRPARQVLLAPAPVAPGVPGVSAAAPDRTPDHSATPVVPPGQGAGRPAAGSVPSPVGVPPPDQTARAPVAAAPGVGVNAPSGEPLPPQDASVAWPATAADATRRAQMLYRGSAAEPLRTAALASTIPVPVVPARVEKGLLSLPGAEVPAAPVAGSADLSGTDLSGKLRAAPPTGAGTGIASPAAHPALPVTAEAVAVIPDAGTPPADPGQVIEPGLASPPNADGHANGPARIMPPAHSPVPTAIGPGDRGGPAPGDAAMEHPDPMRRDPVLSGRYPAVPALSGAADSGLGSPEAKGSSAVALPAAPPAAIIRATGPRDSADRAQVVAVPVPVAGNPPPVHAGTHSLPMSSAAVDHGLSRAQGPAARMSPPGHHPTLAGAPALAQGGADTMALPLSDAVPGVDAVPGALPSAGPTPSAPVAAGGAPAAPTFGPVAQIAPLAIAIATDPGSGTTDIALSPDELGRLQMQVVTDGDTLRIAMLVERPETLDLLRRHAEQLLSDLRQAGFGSATLSFGQGGGAAMEGASEPRTLAGGAAPATVPDILPAPLRPPLAGNGTLDLRL